MLLILKCVTWSLWIYWVDWTLENVSGILWVPPENCINPGWKNQSFFSFILTGQADVFSYGIILCEIIGRVPADPDELPRTQVPKRFVAKVKIKFRLQWIHLASFSISFVFQAPSFTNTFRGQWKLKIKVGCNDFQILRSQTVSFQKVHKLRIQ